MMEEVDFVEDMDSDDLWLKAHLEDIVDRYAHKGSASKVTLCL